MQSGSVSIREVKYGSGNCLPAAAISSRHEEIKHDRIIDQTMSAAAPDGGVMHEAWILATIGTHGHENENNALSLIHI